MAAQTHRTADQIARERAERAQAAQWGRYGRTSTATDLRRSAASMRDQRRSGR
jgi:hypothetical protein